MSYYNNYVNSSYRTTQVSPKYSLDVGAKLRGTRASPTPESSAAYRQTTQSNKNESSYIKSSQAINQGNQSKEFKLSTLKSRESSKANSMQGNQIDFRYNPGDNHGLQTGNSRQAAHEPLGIAQTLNLNALQRTTNHQSSPSKYALIMSKQKKIGGTMTTKQSPSPIMGRQPVGSAKSKNSQYKIEPLTKSSQKLVIKTNDGSKKTQGQPVKKVIKRALIDIRHNQPGEAKKQTRINEAKNSKQMASQTGSRNRGAMIASKPQMQLLEQVPSNQSRNMSKTPLSRISNNLPSRAEDTSNRSNNSQRRDGGSHSRGNSQYDRINMIYNKYISDNKANAGTAKAGEKSTTLSPAKHVKQNSIMKKQQMAPQKQPLQLQSGATKLSKTLKQQEMRALKGAQLNNPNVSERRSNSRTPMTTSPPKQGNQAQTTSKKKIGAIDPKSGARVSLFTVNSNGAQDVQSQTKRETHLNQQQISQHLQLVNNQALSPEYTKAVTANPGQRVDKQPKDLGLSVKMQEGENGGQGTSKHEQIKLELPLADDLNQNQLLYNQLQKKCATQRERPMSRRRNQMKNYQQALGHQHNRREIIKSKKRDSNSVRSMSNSSKNIADSINKSKLQNRGNDSMASSKKVIRDDKNATSNQRSRSTQVNRANGTKPSSKNNRKTEQQQHSMQVNPKATNNRMPSLSNSSTSSHAMTSNGDELCIGQNGANQQMNKTQTLGSKYDVRSHKINMVANKNGNNNEGEQVSIMNNSPSKFSLNKMSVGSSRNLRYQQQEEDYMEDRCEKDNQVSNSHNLASSKNEGELFNYDVDKSKEDFSKVANDSKQEPQMKVEIISTQMVSNKKESHKKTDKKKHIVDKKGSIVQNNEAFNKAFDLIKTAEQMEENNFKKASTGGDSAENRGSHSLSSSDSLIQTQRKLKQEYAVRLSQQNIDPKKLKQQKQYDADYANTPELVKQRTDDEPEKRPRIGKNSNKLNPFNPCEGNDQEAKQKAQNSNQKEENAQKNYMDNKSGLKQKLVKRTRISLIDKEHNNNNATPLKDGLSQTVKGGKKLKSGLKFPIQEFISASSDQEEDMIIEKYSQVLRSQEKVFEKKNRDSIISNRGSKNFRNSDESKNVNAVTGKAEMRNQIAGIQNQKTIKSARDEGQANGKRESLPQITEKQSNITSSYRDSKLQSVPRFKKTPGDKQNGTPNDRILSETTFDSQIYMSNDEKEHLQALNNRNLQSNMSIKNTQASSKDQNYQSKLSNLQNNIDISSQNNDQPEGISKSQQIKLSNNLVKEDNNKTNTQKRKDNTSTSGNALKDIPEDQVKKVYTESINPFQTDKKNCPYTEKNRSPDSFVRISMNEDNGIPVYDRISHVSHRSSHISYISHRESIVENSNTKLSSNGRREEQKLFKQKSSKQSLKQSIHKDQPTSKDSNNSQIQEQPPSTPKKNLNVQAKEFKEASLSQKTQSKQESNQQNSSKHGDQKTKSGKDQAGRSQNIEINIEKILQIQKVLQKINKNFKVFTLNYGIKNLRLLTNQENYEFESDNNEMIQNVIQYCEDWWNIIREPQVSALLIKCQRILSNQHIQINLKKSFVYQLVFFTITGYLMSCAQYQFHKQLKTLTERCYFNFLLLCKILVEKFPQETLHKNVWANQLSQIFENNNEFNDEIAQLEKDCLAKQRESMLSQKQQQRSPLQFSREVKYRYLRNNNMMIFESLATIAKESNMIKQLRQKDLHSNDIELADLHQIYSHQLFRELQQCLQEVNEKDQQSDLNDFIERFGRALREDYNEDSPSKSALGGGQNLSDEFEGKYMPTNNTLMSQEKDLQDQLQQSLRVQVDQGHKLVKPPYLPPMNTLDGRRKYTLVLDLDETLLHFEELNDNEGQLSIRPGADSFLKLMSSHFEIVIFTAGTEEYADWALEFMENVSCISHRLYRQHALPFKGYYVKDLSRIGRELTKTIIVDNIAENFALQPANGILIKTWISDPKDTSLFELAPLLLKVVESQTEDVRELLRFYQQQNAELMHSIAYGSKDQLNTLSNQMTIAQDQQAENYDEYNECTLSPSQNKNNQMEQEFQMVNKGTVSTVEEAHSNEEKSHPSMKEQLQNSVDSRQRKLKQSVGNSYLSQSSSEAATPNNQ